MGPKVTTKFTRMGFLLTTGRAAFHDTVEARMLEYDCPSSSKYRKKEKTAQIIPDPYSNFLESTVSHPLGFFRTSLASAASYVLSWVSRSLPAPHGRGAAAHNM